MIKSAVSSIKSTMSGLVDILMPALSLMVLVEVIFGAGAFGFSVISNVTNLVSSFGENGFVGLLALMIIIGFFKKD